VAGKLGRGFLWAVVVLAWALVVIFGAAVFFGGDLLTRVVGLVIALFALAIALGLQRFLRRFRHAKPPAEPPEPVHLPDDLDAGGFDFPGVGHFKDRTALHLDRDGFDAIRMGKPRRYAWSDVEAFVPTSLYFGGPSGGVYGHLNAAAFRLRGRGHSLGDRIARWGTNADVILPSVAMAPDDLVKAMERYRQRYSAVVYTDASGS
jgi:hypothetical protein